MSDKEKCATAQPPDGGWGWMVVLASFVVHLLNDGIGYSFGIFYFEFLEYYKSGNGETAWVGSLVRGLMLVFGSLAGVLTDKYGCRITTIVGALIASTGFVLSMFSPNLHFLYFSFGILSGLGFSLVYLSAVVCVGHYFENKRAFAVGLASSGSGIGAFIFNPFAKFLIDKYGWRGAILIEAGIILNCAVCGAIFRPLQSLMTTKDDFESTDRHLDKLSDGIHLPLRSNYFQESHQPLSETVSPANTISQSKFHNPVHKEADLLYSEVMKETLSKKCCCFDIPAEKHISMNKLCGFSRLKDWIFILFVVSNVLASLGLPIPFIFLYDFAVEQGIDEDSAKWLGSVIGISNTCGRAICGLLADRPKVNKLFLFSVALTVLGITTALFPLCSTYTLFLILSCVFGLSYGIYVPLMSVVLVDLLGLEMLNNSFGVLLMFKGMANLIGPPVAGWLFDTTGSYNAPYIISGVITAASGIILKLTPLVKRCRQQKNCQADTIEQEQLNKNNG